MKPIDMRNAIAAQCGFKDSKAQTCVHCTQTINADKQGTWIDETGGDVCGSYGSYGNEPHIPSKAVIPRDEANALCKEHGFATLDEQEQYWKVRDKDLDRIESNAQWQDERDRDLEHESRVDYETWYMPDDEFVGGD